MSGSLLGAWMPNRFRQFEAKDMSRTERQGTFLVLELYVSNVENERPLRSPCIGVCCPGEHGLCTGCLRNAMEIAEWGVLDNEEKRAVLARIRRRDKGDIC